MTELLVHPREPGADGTFLAVTPDSARWAYVGFEAVRLHPAAALTRQTGEREACIVVIEGTVTVSSSHGEWAGLGGRADPWSGPPDAAYLPPGTEFSVSGSGEIGICWAPAPRAAPRRGCCRARRSRSRRAGTARWNGPSIRS